MMGYRYLLALSKSMWRIVIIIIFFSSNLLKNIKDGQQRMYLF